MLSDQQKKILVVAGLAVAVAGGWLVLTGKARAEGVSRPARIAADEPAAAPKGGVSVYLGAHAGATIATTELSADLGPFGSASLDGIGSHGVIGGVHAGIDYITTSRFFAGLYGFYDWQSTKTTASFGGNSFSIGLGESYGIGVRGGYDWGWAKTYGLIGWRHTDLDWGVLSAASSSLPGSLTGMDLGVGMSTPIAPNVDVGLEAIWTKYQSENVGDLLNTDTRQLSGMARINFRFGG